MNSKDNEKREKIDLTKKTPDEILTYANERGYQLTDEQLDEIAGGGWLPDGSKCPNCGSTNTEIVLEGGDPWWLCKDCGHMWL